MRQPLQTIWPSNPDCESRYRPRTRSPRADCRDRASNIICMVGTNSQTFSRISTARTSPARTPPCSNIYGDARASIQQLNQQQFIADAIFSILFSCCLSPIWTVEFTLRVAQCCARVGGLLPIPAPPRPSGNDFS